MSAGAERRLLRAVNPLARTRKAAHLDEAAVVRKGQEATRKHDVGTRLALGGGGGGNFALQRESACFAASRASHVRPLT